MPPPQPPTLPTGFGGAGSLGAALQVGDDASLPSSDHPHAPSAPLGSKEQASELVQQVEQGAAAPGASSSAAAMEAGAGGGATQGCGGANASSSTAFSLDSQTIARIQAIPKGERPDPCSYMPEAVIASQLAQFNDGAARFMSQSNLDKYGPAQRDGTAFVMTKAQADKLLHETAGNPRAMEDALGLPPGFLESEQLVRVDIPEPRKLGARVPSGNEAGANPMWIPGGKLPTGNLEAVIDLGSAPPGSYIGKKLIF